MCGIAGIVSVQGSQRITREHLRAMAARIAHRGPDGEGIWLNHEEEPSIERPQVGFAFRRLAVLDCDERAMQPMHTPDGRHTIVFNGEIYNFRDLRAQLPDLAWRTTGDTEVLLHALATWGISAVRRPIGMSAIAWWDAQARALVLVRDRMGQKPLYYAHTAGSVAFASELPALRVWPHWDTGICDRALGDYLSMGCVAAPRTIYRGAAQVLPSHTLTISPGGAAEQHRYFDCNEEIPNTQSDEWFWPHPEVNAAVARQLVSDVPLGVFLSGGIDSSVIAACARRHGRVKTFSIGFADARYDERPFAREVARHLETEHHEFVVTPDAAADLPKLAAVFGEPFGDSSALPTHYLARETRRAVTVALSGDGGDELFGGYDRYAAIGWPTAWLRPLAPLGEMISGGHPKSRLTRAGRFLRAAGLSEALRYRNYLALFDDATLRALVPGMDLEADIGAWKAAWEGLRRTRDATATALAMDRITYLPNDLLTKADRCSMLHGLEVRAPFMDHLLVQRAAGLSRQHLLRGGKKRMLREAFARELPESVFKRPKMGFAVPIGQWLRTDLREMLRDHLFSSDSICRSRLALPVVERLVEEHASERRDHSQRLYALLMLELWRRHAE